MTEPTVHPPRDRWYRTTLASLVVGLAIVAAGCGSDPVPSGSPDDGPVDGSVDDGADGAPQDDDGAVSSDGEDTVPEGATEVRLTEATSTSVGDLELSASVRGEGADAVAVVTVYDLRDEAAPFEVVELAAGDVTTVFDHEITAVTVTASSPPDADVEGGQDGGVELVVLPPA